MTETIEDTETIKRLLESLDDTVPCSFEGCDREATHLLVCATCLAEGAETPGRETICTPHLREQILYAFEQPKASIVFDQTCGHHPVIRECQIVKI